MLQNWKRKKHKACYGKCETGLLMKQLHSVATTTKCSSTSHLLGYGRYCSQYHYIQQLKLRRRNIVQIKKSIFTHVSEIRCACNKPHSNQCRMLIQCKHIISILRKGRTLPAIYTSHLCHRNFNLKITGEVVQLYTFRSA
jgi:hypothetical protein